MNGKTLYIILIGALAGCHHEPPKQDPVKDTRSLHERVSEDLRQLLPYWAGQAQKVDKRGREDLYQAAALTLFYGGRGYHPVWASLPAAGDTTGQPAMRPMADSLMAAIRDCPDDGLRPEWYHDSLLVALMNNLAADSSARLDAMKWAQADLLLSDAFMRLCQHLRYGLLPPDSLRLSRDSAYSDSALAALLDTAIQAGRSDSVLRAQAPAWKPYRALRDAVAAYRRDYGQRQWDSLPSAREDSAAFPSLLRRRLIQGGELDSAAAGHPDAVKAAVQRFQRAHGLYPDGVAGARTVAALNKSAAYRRWQIALNMERWRHFADTMPETCLIVNIPSFQMTLWDHDTIALSSKVIVGEPDHATPLLNSRLINFQLYPYWRVPRSIFAREMLPRIRRDIGYLAAHNLEVVDRHNNVVDPRTLPWKNYSQKYFPYVIRQMTGLDNSLGIIKFNFRNPYSVYLHDTNLRQLFNQTHRALSHGCVRVEQWEPLAMFLIRGDTARHLPDSVLSWMAFRQQKWVALSQRIPLYIRYFTCTVNSQGGLVFHDDIYGYDSLQIPRLVRVGQATAGQP